MLFNSYEFLFLFLPLVLFGYYVIFRVRGRTVCLTIMSYVFYGWWDYRFCGLMLLSTVIDYVAGHRLYNGADVYKKKAWMILSIISNLSLLGFFKYWDLFATTLNHFTGWFFCGGASATVSPEVLPVLSLVLPVGISFYTFQSMSYSIDIYRGKAKPVSDFWRFACYVSLFPQLIAGPIVRYKDIAQQLEKRTHTWDKAARGIFFFILGLAKKVLIADSVAGVAGHIFNGNGGGGLLPAWLGVTAYTLQIYFDFSGYSDMAVGLGMMFGFEFPQNFNSPYKAISITDFWRRWHISLSSWLRDYLYIPLGGSRRGDLRTYANLFTVMLLGGLWHGASWTFLLWGVYHGALLALERLCGKRNIFVVAPRIIQRIVVLLIVMYGWVLFRCGSFSDIIIYTKTLFGGCGLRGNINTYIQEPLSLGAIFCAAIIALFMKNTWELNLKVSCWTFLWMVTLFAISLCVIMVNSSSPFLYFQF